VTPETVSVTLSVVDLALFGMAWSATSGGKAVSLQWLGGWEREEEEGDVLSWMSLRPGSDMLTVGVGWFEGLVVLVCW
jgi:hypothetical protein